MVDQNQLAVFQMKAESPALGRAILVVGIIIRAALWIQKHFWLDAYSLKAGIISHSFRELLFGPVGFNQSSPIGFTILSKAIGCVTHYSEKALVSPLLVAGIATLLLLKRLLDNANVTRAKNLMLLILALHPGLILYSAEFKPYGIDVLVAALFLLYTVRGLDETANKRRFSALCTIAPLFSYATYFVMPFSFALLFLKQVSRKAGKRESLPVRLADAGRMLAIPALCRHIGRRLRLHTHGSHDARHHGWILG